MYYENSISKIIKQKRKILENDKNKEKIHDKINDNNSAENEIYSQLCDENLINFENNESDDQT